MVLTLVISMLAPAVCTLIDVELASVMINDFAEEESQKKGDTENAEKDIYFFYLTDVSPFDVYQEYQSVKMFSEHNSIFNSEVILPPPEPIV